MRVVFGGRRSGKTFQMIIEAAKTDGQIICSDQKQVDYIQQLAKDMGAEIKKPLTHDDLFNGGLGQKLRGQAKRSVLVDDAGLLLERFFRQQGAASIEAISIDNSTMTWVDRANG